MKAGRKSNPKCSPQICYRPSPEIRQYLDSLNPVGAQENITRIIEREIKKQCPDNIVDLQTKLVELDREQKRLGIIRRECENKLENIVTNPVELEAIYLNIHKAVFPEKHLDK